MWFQETCAQSRTSIRLRKVAHDEDVSVGEVDLTGAPAVAVGRDAEQRPRSPSRIAATTLGELMRGQQYQSIVPSVATSGTSSRKEANAP